MYLLYLVLSAQGLFVITYFGFVNMQGRVFVPGGFSSLVWFVLLVLGMAGLLIILVL
jgi:hypothetical protein